MFKKLLLVGLLIPLSCSFALNAMLVEENTKKRFEGDVERCEVLVEMIHQNYNPERMEILKTHLLIELKFLEQRCERGITRIRKCINELDMAYEWHERFIEDQKNELNELIKISQNLKNLELLCY